MSNTNITPCEIPQQRKTEIIEVSKMTDFETIFEPKTIPRFIVDITDSEDHKQFLPCFIIKSIDRPSMILKDGLWHWQPIKMRLYDPIQKCPTPVLMENKKTPTKQFDIETSILGPVGDIVEKWVIKRSNLVSVDWGNLDWSNTGDPTLIELTFDCSDAGIDVII